jgi:hypothetical protein
MRPKFPSYHDPGIEYPAKILFDRLRALELTPGEYAIFGSGPIAVRGLISKLGDLDVIVKDATWDRVKGLGEVVRYGEDETVDLGTGLSFGRSWGYGHFDIDQLIDDAEIINGLPFVRLSAVIEFKRLAGRPKDLEHIALIEEAGVA